MSVIMTLRTKADPRKLEEYAAENQEAFGAVAERAKNHGVIAHRFYGSDDGQVLVVDEWPDPQSFQSFFEQSRGDIQPMMEAAGAQGEPEVTFWHELDAGFSGRQRLTKRARD